jgi:hypothetical protein
LCGAPAFERGDHAHSRGARHVFEGGPFMPSLDIRIDLGGVVLTIARR